MDLIGTAKHYLIVVKDWFEYSGKEPDPETERVEKRGGIIP